MMNILWTTENNWVSNEAKQRSWRTIDFYASLSFVTTESSFADLPCCSATATDISCASQLLGGTAAARAAASTVDAAALASPLRHMGEAAREVRFMSSASCVTHTVRTSADEFGVDVDEAGTDE